MLDAPWTAGENLQMNQYPSRTSPEISARRPGFTPP